MFFFFFLNPKENFWWLTRVFGSRFILIDLQFHERNWSFELSIWENHFWSFPLEKHNESRNPVLKTEWKWNSRSKSLFFFNLKFIFFYGFERGMAVEAKAKEWEKVQLKKNIADNVENLRRIYFFFFIFSFATFFSSIEITRLRQ